MLVGAITLVAFALRVSQMNQGLYGDEMWTYGDVVGRGLGEAIRTVNTGVENNPPLFFIFAWLCAKLGDPTVWIRLPSLIFATATVPLVYLLGRETVGRRAGLIGAAILAVSPFATFYAVEARPYATMVFFVALSTLALVRAVRTGSVGWWIGYTLAVAAAAYTHYTSIFLLVVQAAWSLWVCRNRLRAPLLASAGAVALYAPWLGHVQGKGLSVFSAIEPLGVTRVLTDLVRPLPGYPYASLKGIPTAPGLVVLALACGSGLVWWLRRIQAARREAHPVDATSRAEGHAAAASSRARPERLLIALLALATPVGLLLYSLLVTDLWTARGLSASMPAAALVIGFLLAQPPPVARAVAITLVLLTLIAGTVNSFGSTYARPPFREVAAQLDRLAGRGDPILIYPSLSNVSASIRAELHRPHLVIEDRAARWPAQAPRRPAFVVIDELVGRVLHLQWPHPSGFQLIAARSYPGLDPLTVLSYRPDGLR